MIIENLKVSELKHFGGNPRKISEQDFESLKKSIQKFGFVEPLVIDENNFVIGGNQRLDAAESLLINEVPCFRVQGLSDSEKKALNIALNRISGEFDEEQLSDMLKSIQEIDLEALHLTGFDDDELCALLNLGIEIKEDDFDVDSAAKEQKYKIERGEIWQLGENRLMCGDATSKEDVDKLMNGEKADMVFTDPPYGVAIGAKNRMLNSFQKAGRNLKDIENDSDSPEKLFDTLLVAFKKIREICSDCCSVFVCSPPGGDFGLMMMMMREAGFKVRHQIVWNKNRATFSMGRLDYDYKHEAILYTWTDKHIFYGAGSQKNTVWDFDNPLKSSEHPTMKPINLISNALLNNSKQEDIVIDLFGGSGSTLIACEQLNRKCYMMEIDPTYCSVILERWENLTGKQAVKL